MCIWYFVLFHSQQTQFRLVGHLLCVPFTSLFHPFISLPENYIPDELSLLTFEQLKYFLAFYTEYRTPEKMYLNSCSGYTLWKSGFCVLYTFCQLCSFEMSLRGQITLLCEVSWVQEYKNFLNDFKPVLSISVSFLG